MHTRYFPSLFSMEDIAERSPPSPRASSPSLPHIMVTIFTTTSQRTSASCSTLRSHGRSICSSAFPPAYNNTQLITAFSQSFLSVARSLDPNNKFYADIKPEWSVWQNGTTEMLFNVTSAGGAVVATTTTDPSLLERCA